MVVLHGIPRFTTLSSRVFDVAEKRAVVFWEHDSHNPLPLPTHTHTAQMSFDGDTVCYLRKAKPFKTQGFPLDLENLEKWEYT